MDKPTTVKILENRLEKDDEVKTVQLDTTINAKPGQFVMLWIPGIGEKPFSLSKLGKNPEITYDVKGKFTKALFELKKGGLVGWRGPYGNGWDAEKKRICIVAGGIGMAPFMPLVEEKCREITVIYGAKNVEFLVFKKKLEKAGVKSIITTDDGSFGKQCYACDALEGMLDENAYDIVLTCGPELLMKKVVDICLKKKIDCKVSLERYMKCGMGICGSCAIDGNGLLVCKDGPVFDARDLKGSEFGEYSRDKSGAKK